MSKKKKTQGKKAVPAQEPARKRGRPRKVVAVRPIKLADVIGSPSVTQPRIVPPACCGAAVQNEKSPPAKLNFLGECLDRVVARLRAWFDA